MVNVADIMITSLETITAFKGGKFRWVMDELQNATIAGSEDKVDITGKQGRKLSSLKRNKAVTISGTNGIISAGLLETQTGGKFEYSEEMEIMHTDYLTVTVGDNNIPTATTNYVANGVVGKEIIGIRKRNASGVLADEFTQYDSTSSVAMTAKQFAYDGENTITFAEGALEAGAEIVVFYNRKVGGSYLDNKSDVYSEKLELYIDAIGEDRCNGVYHVQFYIPKADFDGNFEIAMGDDQTVHAFNAEALPNACMAGGALWTYSIFGVKDEDTAAN